jgi:hypothetical protein
MRTFLTELFLMLTITTVAVFGADNTIGTWCGFRGKAKRIPG